MNENNVPKEGSMRRRKLVLMTVSAALVLAACSGSPDESRPSAA